MRCSCCSIISHSDIQYSAEWTTRGTRRKIKRKSVRRLPLWRSECKAERAVYPGPCPYVTCRYHTYLHVRRDGGIAINYPGLEVWEIPADESCWLDTIKPDGMKLLEIGEKMYMSRERARQIEASALQKIRDSSNGLTLIEVKELIKRMEP